MAHEKIKGGFILKARCVSESDIAHKSPCVREIWDWLLMNANHRPKKVGGVIVGRGQLLRSYQDIRDGLSWKKGYAKITYSEAQTKDAMKVLRSLLMISTTKLLQGMLITILNYDKFQEVSNYEGSHEATNEATNQLPIGYQSPTDKNKNEKNEKNEKELKRDMGVNPPNPDTTKRKKDNFIIPTIEEIKAHCIERNNNVDPERFFNFYESKGWMVGKNKMKNWKSCVITWEKGEGKKTGSITGSYRTDQNLRAAQEFINGR